MGLTSTSASEGLDPHVASLVEAMTTDVASSGRVLLTTVFGDCLLPRDQSISVLDLARLVDGLGVNERLVRTSLHRMSSEGLLVSEREGRRSFYRVHPDAIPTFDSANHRIYERNHPAWDGNWTLAIADPASGTTSTRGRLGHQLAWLGMTSPSPGVFVSPVIAVEQIHELARRHDVDLLVLTRTAVEVGTLDSELRRATLADPDGSLRSIHQDHIDLFTPLVDLADELGDRDAFLVRTLLLNSWRRIALRSPQLPAELVPTDWLEKQTFELTGAIHSRVHGPSERFVDEVAGPSAAPSSPELRFRS